MGIGWERKDTPVEHPKGTRFNRARRTEVRIQKSEVRDQKSGKDGGHPGEMRSAFVKYASLSLK